MPVVLGLAGAVNHRLRPFPPDALSYPCYRLIFYFDVLFSVTRTFSIECYVRRTSPLVVRLFGWNQYHGRGTFWDRCRRIYGKSLI
jgi:hypothetical protein